MGQDSKPAGPLTDLLGDPWVAPRDPRGRKRHRRSVQVAEKVGILKASGTPIEDIARRVGLSEPTLRKYYLRELDHGAELARAVLVEAMWDKAKGGNAAAARFVREELERAPRERRSRPVAAAPLGKKDQADQDARTAHEGTGWSNLLQ